MWPELYGCSVWVCVCVCVFLYNLDDLRLRKFRSIFLQLCLKCIMIFCQLPRGKYAVLTEQTVFIQPLKVQVKKRQ